MIRLGFRHGQGVRPHRGIHQFGASTNKIIFLFVLLFYNDYNMRNQLHNIYDIPCKKFENGQYGRYLIGYIV